MKGEWEVRVTQVHLRTTRCLWEVRGESKFSSDLCCKKGKVR